MKLFSKNVVWPFFFRYKTKTQSPEKWLRGRRFCWKWLYLETVGKCFWIRIL